MYVLSDHLAEIGFDENTGAIVKMKNCRTGYELIRQPELALGLTMLIPVKDHRNNPAPSEKQALSGFEKSSDGQTAVLTYDKIATVWAGTLDITVKITVKLDNGQFSFLVYANNKSPYVIEDIRYPCLGGLAVEEGTEPLQTATLNFLGGLNSTPLSDGFSNPGYYGTDWPTVYLSYPGLEVSAPFILLARESQGLYLGVHHEEPELAAFVHEYKPGYSDNRRRRLLRDQEIDGTPAGFCVSVSRIPFLSPGESMELPPVVAAFYEGDWHNGIQPYLNWRKTWYRPVKSPKWLEDADCWMTLHINSPEGCCRHKYRELPGLMRKAKEKGVQVLQLIGWARGGQDGDEPYQDTNPLLGTKEELKQAIREIEEMGIHVLLMCKFKWADQSTPEYQEELLPHTIKDIYGYPAQFGGYCYQTTLQNVVVGSKRSGAALCHLSKGYRELALREFDKILDLESSGILYDELGNPFQICFDPTHGHKPGASIQIGSMELAKEFYDRATERLGGGFFFAGEGPLDVESQYYKGTYIRSDNGGLDGGPHIPGWKFMNPDMYIATCVVGYDDREMVNQCMAYGYAINYEIRNFKGLPNDAPLTSAYVMQARALRKKLKEYLWTGVFRHTVGVSVRDQDGTGDFLYSRFENRQNGKSAVVVVNDSTEKPLNAWVSLGKSDAQFTVYQIGKEEAFQSNGNVEVPPRSLCVCVEQ